MNNKAIIKNAVTPDNCEALKNILNMNASIVGNHNFQDGRTPDEESETLAIKDIVVSEDDQVLFCKNRPSLQEDDYVQVSELQNNVLSILKEIFSDCYGVQLHLDNQRGGYVFAVNFNYTSEEPEDGLVRAITSSIDPDDAVNKNSIAANIMIMAQQQQLSAYDASKYAKLTKEVKERLQNLLWFAPSNKKKKWIKGENYSLTTIQNRSSWGQVFTNITATIYLNSEKVLAMISGDTTNKFQYNIVQLSSNVTATDALLKIEKYNIGRKKQVASKYGIHFVN